MLALIVTHLLAAAMLQAPAPNPPQGTPPKPAQVAAPTPAPSTPTTAEVPPTAPVITLHGLCPTPASSGTTSKKGPSTAQACTTIVTRAQLDQLISALNTQNQPITPQMRRQFAQGYAELLAYAQAAKKAGTDDAKFAELMRFVRLTTLVKVYRTQLDEKYRKPADTEIADYYKENTPKFEEITFGHIFIPAKNPAAQNKDEWEKKAAQVANDMHDRAAKGEDMDKLQKEAYSELGLTINPPPTSQAPQRKATLPPQTRDLSSLSPGDVSKVEQEPAGYSIYKVLAKQVAPLDKVKNEISRDIFSKKRAEKEREITSSVKADLNEKYFGPAAAAAMPPPSVAPPAATRPAASPAASPQSGSAVNPQPQASPASTPKP